MQGSSAIRPSTIRYRRAAAEDSEEEASKQPISQGPSADDAAADGALAEPETEPSEESSSIKSGGFHLEAAVLQAAVEVGKAVLRKPAVLGAAAAAVAVASLALLAIKKSQGRRGKGSGLGKGKRTARGKVAAAAGTAGAAADAASVAASSSVYEDARSEVSDAASAKGLANGTSQHDSSSSAASKAAGGKKQAAARKASGPPTTGPLAGLKATSACAPLADGSACVVRRKIAADNSCMFNAVGYVMHASTSKASWLRSVVAQEVSSDQQFYSAAFLGMANARYCNWIMNPMNWGGGIELAILAKHYNYEIAAWNIETGKCHVFGEDLGAKKQVMVIYNGVHYDALALAAHPKAEQAEDITEFNPRSKHGKMIIAAAQKLVALNNKGARFVAGSGSAKAVSLRCADCDAVVKGQAGAAAHAQATGHVNFSQA